MVSELRRGPEIFCLPDVVAREYTLSGCTRMLCADAFQFDVAHGVGVAEAPLSIEDFQPREPALAVVISRDAFREMLRRHGGFAEGDAQRVHFRIVAYFHGVSSLFSPFAQLFSNPIWIAPQIEDGENLRLIAVFAVVNTKWETARQHPVKFEVHWVNPTERAESLNVGQ